LTAATGADWIEGTINKAHQLINLYKELGVDKERVLIKVSSPASFELHPADRQIASTYEGIQAAKDLEKEGIQ
jgi:transaldolase